jgi:hypothetical protein
LPPASPCNPCSTASVNPPVASAPDRRLFLASVSCPVLVFWKIFKNPLEVRSASLYRRWKPNWKPDGPSGKAFGLPPPLSAAGQPGARAQRQADGVACR